ncbi:hypothetical protein [Bradyrhizobium barranii]
MRNGAELGVPAPATRALQLQC